MANGFGRGAGAGAVAGAVASGNLSLARQRNRILGTQVQNQQTAQLTERVQGDIGALVKALDDAVKAADAKGQPRDKLVGVKNELMSAARKEVQLANQAGIPINLDLIERQFDNVLAQPSPEQIARQEAIQKGLVKKAEEEAEATTLLSPEKEAQEIRIARERAKAAPGAALASLLAEERLAKTRAERAKLEGDVKKQEREEKEAKEKRQKRIEAQATKAEIITSKVDQALKILDDNFDFTVTGALGGQVFNQVGGTDARNLKATLDTIQANLAFNELQAMREASATGGALGQVAIREIELLQQAVSSLDQSQDGETLLRNLLEVKSRYDTVTDLMSRMQPGEAEAEDNISEMSTEELEALEKQLANP